jgi:hypothetical protein
MASLINMHCAAMYICKLMPIASMNPMMALALQADPGPPDAAVAQMLPAFAADDVQLGELLSNRSNTAVYRGTVTGQPAVIKCYTLDQPWPIYGIRDEVQQPLSPVPVVVCIFLCPD